MSEKHSSQLAIEFLRHMLPEGPWVLTAINPAPRKERSERRLVRSDQEASPTPLHGLTIITASGTFTSRATAYASQCPRSRNVQTSRNSASFTSISIL